MGRVEDTGACPGGTERTVIERLQNCCRKLELEQLIDDSVYEGSQ